MVKPTTQFICCMLYVLLSFNSFIFYLGFICDVSFIFCPAGYKITNIIAVYSNRLKNVCQVANPNINEGRCWRDVREEVKRECDNQMVCVVDKKRFPIFLGCPQTGYIEMLYQCIKQGRFFLFH